MMAKWITAMTLLVSFLWINPGLAHVHLESSSPSDGRTVASPPEIILRFSGPLVTRASAAKLVNANGNEVPAALMLTSSSEMAARPVKPLAPGVYRLTWTAVGEDDGHRIRGSFSFTVK